MNLEQGGRVEKLTDLSCAQRWLREGEQEEPMPGPAWVCCPASSTLPTHRPISFAQQVHGLCCRKKIGRAEYVPYKFCAHFRIIQAPAQPFPLRSEPTLAILVLEPYQGNNASKARKIDTKHTYPDSRPENKNIPKQKEKKPGENASVLTYLFQNDSIVVGWMAGLSFSKCEQSSAGI